MKNRSTDPKPTAAEPAALTLDNCRGLCRTLAVACRELKARCEEAERLLRARLPAEGTEEDREATIRCEANLWWTVDMTIGNAIGPDAIESLGYMAERLEEAAECTDESLREEWIAEKRAEIIDKWPKLAAKG